MMDKAIECSRKFDASSGTLFQAQSIIQSVGEGDLDAAMDQVSLLPFSAEFAVTDEGADRPMLEELNSSLSQLVEFTVESKKRFPMVMGEIKLDQSALRRLDKINDRFESAFRKAQVHVASSIVDCLIGN